MALVDSARLPAAGWLRSRDFDLVLICGITALALAAGGLIALMPAGTRAVDASNHQYPDDTDDRRLLRLVAGIDSESLSLH